MNVVVITGNATNNVEAKKGKDSGNLYANFVLANHHHRREVSFIDVVAFDAQAEWAEKYVTKGREYSVVGRLDGKGGRMKVIANKIDFQDFPRDKGPVGKKALRKKAEGLRPKKKKK